MEGARARCQGATTASPSGRQQKPYTGPKAGLGQPHPTLLGHASGRIITLHYQNISFHQLAVKARRAVGPSGSARTMAIPF